MNQRTRLAYSVGAAVLTAGFLMALSMSRDRAALEERAAVAEKSAVATLNPATVAPTKNPTPSTPPKPGGFDVRKKNARKLRDFIEGRLTGDTPPFENHSLRLAKYFEANPPAWTRDMDPQILVDLCWEGFAEACHEAGGLAITRASLIEDKLKDPKLPIAERTAMMSELAQLKSIARDTITLACLQGVAMSCTNMPYDMHDTHNDLLKKQTEYFCSHGNPAYCTARADLRPRTDEDPPPTKQTPQQKEFYSKGCSGGDLIGCDKVLEDDATPEAVQAARRALEDDCRAGESEEVRSFPWSHALSCQAMTKYHLKSGDPREALAVGRKRCEDGDALQCYEVASLMIKAGDGHSSLEMMKRFCQINDNAKYLQPSKADCKLMIESPTLTNEAWAALLRSPSNVFFETPDSRTFRELYEQRTKR